MSRTDAPPGRANAARLEEFAAPAAPKAGATPNAFPREEASWTARKRAPRAAPARLIDLERRARFERSGLCAV